MHAVTYIILLQIKSNIKPSSQKINGKFEILVPLPWGKEESALFLN